MGCRNLGRDQPADERHREDYFAAKSASDPRLTEDERSLTMKIARRQHRPLVIAALVAIFSLLSSATASATKAESPQLAQLLADANDEAFELERDATDTQMLIRTDENWVDHALVLGKMKGHVDNLDLIIKKLIKAQKSGSDLQAQAVEQMLPLVTQLSANTTAAINYLKQSKTRPTSETYTRYLEKNAETAHQLSSMISSLIDYEKSMTEVERLRSKLEVPEN